LVQREEVMPPMESRPYLAWMRFSSLAAWAMAAHADLVDAGGHRVVGVEAE